MAQKNKGSKNGFLLLEILMVITIILILSSVAVTSGLRIFRLKQIDTTKDRLEQIYKAIKIYYDDTDNLPGSLDKISSYLNENNLKDAWDNPFIYKENITYNGINYSGVILSRGPNIVQDSQINSGNFIPKKDDIYFLFSLKGEKNDFDKTREKIVAADAAYHAYVLANGVAPANCSPDSNICILSLVKNNYLDGKSSYDSWGSLLVWNGSKFVSPGPDKIYKTSDDLS